VPPAVEPIDVADAAPAVVEPPAPAKPGRKRKPTDPPPTPADIIAEAAAALG